MTALVLFVAAPALGMAPATQPAQPAHPDKLERRIFVAAPLQRVWDALCTKALSDDWFPLSMLSADLQPGGKFVYGSEGSPAMAATVLDVQLHEKLSFRYEFVGGHPGLMSEPATRVTFTLTPRGPTTQLSLVHDELEGSPVTALTSGDTWDAAFSRLKTRLETGRPLAFSYEQARQFEEASDGRPPPESLNPLAFIRGVTLYVADVKTARAWYEATFELPAASFSLDWFTLSMAQPAITVKEPAKGTSAQPGQVQFTFHAPDVEGLYRRLESLGVRFDQPLSEGRYVKEFSFVGPAGHRFLVSGPARPPTPRPATRPATGPSR